jgi:hypothetical protein
MVASQAVRMAASGDEQVGHQGTADLGIVDKETAVAVEGKLEARQVLEDTEGFHCHYILEVDAGTVDHEGP